MLVKSDTNTFYFKGKILTDFQGYSNILSFYHFCNVRYNCCITLDWNGLIMLDANLSALLCGMMHHLKKNNGLRFFLDVGCLSGGLNVFWRNGFAHYVLKSKKVIEDDRFSTIPLKAFKIEDCDKYCQYIESDLLQHRGVDPMKFKDKNRVKDSYFELFNNYEIHSETQEPILCCGQFFPTSGELKFTMVDLGCGFLKKIADYTKNNEIKISRAIDAIQWAIRGGSTKVDAEGGTGLKKMLFYCKSSNSAIQIVSDNCFWSFDNAIMSHTLEQPFVGTTINLIMRYN